MDKLSFWDPTTGREWNLWQVSVDTSSEVVEISNGNLVQAGIESGDGNDPGDCRIKENGFKGSRGIGHTISGHVGATGGNRERSYRTCVINAYQHYGWVWNMLLLRLSSNILIIPQEFPKVRWFAP